MYFHDNNHEDDFGDFVDARSFPEDGKEEKDSQATEEDKDFLDFLNKMKHWNKVKQTNSQLSKANEDFGNFVIANNDTK